MKFIGIDPGAEGAIAELCVDCTDYPGQQVPEQHVEVYPMPMLSNQPDIREIVHLLHGLKYNHRVTTPMFVMVEETAYMPAKFGGGKTNWFRGGWYWLFETILTLADMPHAFVRPQRWQKELLVGTPKAAKKQRSVIAVRRLMPGVSFKGDGQADAILLAEFARRTIK